MTSSLSDTLAMVNDTIAGVKIIEHNAAADTAATDSAVTEHALIEKDRPLDFLDTARADRYQDFTISMMPDSADSARQTVILREMPGVAGIPADNNIIRNDAVSALILACFFITVSIFSVARDYIGRQTKRFFSRVSKSGSIAAETINEAKIDIYFTIQTCLIFALVTYILFTACKDTDSIGFSDTLVIPIASGAYILYSLIKYILYMTADSVFYDDRKIKQQHTDDLCYIMTVQGLFLFPVLLLSISTGIDTSSLVIYLVTVIVFAKLLAFYKAISTFSGHYKSILQIILYFCALEMIPLMSLCGILVMIAKYL